MPLGQPPRTLGTMLGDRTVDPNHFEGTTYLGNNRYQQVLPAVQSLSIPNSAGVRGAGLAGGGAGTMPGAGEVDWTAAPNVLTQQLNAYFAKRGVGSNETPYWVSKAQELVARGREINDPNYASMRLSQSDVFGGGYGGGTSTATAPGQRIAPVSRTGLGAYLSSRPYRTPGRYVQTPRVGGIGTGYEQV
jgi:hypothetical protein